MGTRLPPVRMLHAALAGLCILLPATMARSLRAQAATPAAPAAAARPAAHTDDARAIGLWRNLAPAVPRAMALSKPILLGNRDPTFCTVADLLVHDGDMRRLPFHVRGGIGMRLAALCMAGEPRATPLADFDWHQTRLRPALERIRARNAQALRQASQVAEQAESLARAIESWTAIPPGFTPSGLTPQDHWSGHCINALDLAIARRDLPLCRQWARELASAAFALADLHRWVDLLADNGLAALAFQNRGRSLFTENLDDFAGRYNYTTHISQFPGGSLTMSNLRNFLEVEHQAEWLYQVPQDYLEFTLDGDSCVKTDGLAVTPAAMWIPPNLRGLFVRLRDNLSAPNQQAWDRAAHTPYERSYLVNMLFQTNRSGTAASLGLVLRRLDALQPAASVASLMSVIFCNAGNFDGGAACRNDRFDLRLLRAAEQLTGDNECALLVAQRLTNNLFGGWHNYQPTPDLHAALNTRKMDCLTATGLIGSLFRNSGRPGSYRVRWCSGVIGHSVAAVERADGDPRDIILADGLDASQQAVETWSRTYADGHPWPAGGPLEHCPPPYAAELYGRGLDTYLWLEGYIVRGPNAGTFLEADAPYLRPRSASALVKSRTDVSAPAAAPPTP